MCRWSGLQAGKARGGLAIWHTGHRPASEKKLKSLEVEAATCAKLTDLFGAGFTSPAAAGAPGDERGGLDNDERVEADMVDHSTCESLRSCFPDTGRAGRGVTLGLPFWAGLQLQI
ncbi:unnamed protein product [Pleuronectes platessa]|uniref:Uncharacterized protein n=1 Tax=Pleuronectes platessa TaxID=8262 RepID=A0A9N7TXJ8_PLEPL|nr:unnamed protein product [Pleuronectes platessa]